MNENDKEQLLRLQRCIDGEMEELEQIEFLNLLEREGDPSGWRTLALDLSKIRR